VDVGQSTIACRRIGSGPPVVLLHGWPFHGFTWRHLVPRLAPRFTCWVPDLPGAGDTVWTAATRFGMDDHARAVQRMADALGLGAYAVVAHDTGATVARLLASTDARVRGLVLLDTEVPGHRPPWIPLYRVAAGLPGARTAFRLFLRSAVWRRSTFGFGGCFADPARIDATFLALFVAPFLASDAYADGQLRYLRGIDWALVDDLARVHRCLQMPVQLVWGAEDRIFPLAEARRMAPEFPGLAGVQAIAHARFLVHEEQPDAVAAAVLPFLADCLWPALDSTTTTGPSGTPRRSTASPGMR
jgi:pimeloyl-ACP methyl ester carboxylesterase